MYVCLVWLDMCLSSYISNFTENLGILNVWANSYKSMRQRRWVSGSRGGRVVLSEPLKNRHSGQSTGINILSVSGSVQGRFWGTAVYLREGMLEKLNGGQDLNLKKKKKDLNRVKQNANNWALWSTTAMRVAHLWKEWPLILGLLGAVSHQPFHGFGAVLIELAEVWR